jgi:hypothetical protein
MATAPIRGQDALRQMTALNAACPARKSPTPPRIIQEAAWLPARCLLSSLYALPESRYG